MITYEECVELGLIKRIAPSEQQAKEQMKKAKILLTEAKNNIETKNPNSAVMAGYSAALDSARALLFRDGWREKSHACVARYIEAKYSAEFGDLIYLLDEYRDQRHRTMYSGDYYPTIDEAKKIVSFADKFVKKADEILGGK